MLKKIIVMSLILGNLSLYANNTPETTLIVRPMDITVNGKQTQIYTIVQPDGTWGYTGVEGQDFDAQLINDTTIPLTIHWHGIIDPYKQDGVAYVSQAPIPPGGVYDYHFPLKQNGTYWMHSHEGLSLQQEMSAPFIIESANDPYKNDKSVVMLMTDFSFTSPEEINAKLRAPKAMNMNMNMNMGGMSMNKPDLNDVKYDAYLTNDQTLANPPVTRVTPGETVRLRVIDGSAASNFFINLGKLSGQVIATDGHFIKPVVGSIFSLTEGQRLDIVVTIPKSVKGFYPILGQAEGTDQQTGLILATPNAAIPKISPTLPQTLGAINPLQDKEFHAINPLPVKPITRNITLTLGGDMQKYIWTINGQSWPKVTPIEVKEGDRVQMTLVNDTSMAHPMHIHGHTFEVTAVNGQAIVDGPLRDTVYVPANGTATIIFDANNPGIWMFHCHILYHGEDGMMTIIQYQGIPLPASLSAAS